MQLTTNYTICSLAAGVTMDEVVARSFTKKTLLPRPLQAPELAWENCSWDRFRVDHHLNRDCTFLRDLQQKVSAVCSAISKDPNLHPDAHQSRLVSQSHSPLARHKDMLQQYALG